MAGRSGGVVVTAELTMVVKCVSRGNTSGFVGYVGLNLEMCREKKAHLCFFRLSIG
jgi:hypothetical protein